MERILFCDLTCAVVRIPSGPQNVLLGLYDASLLLLGQVDERQLDHAQEVVSGQPVLVEHLQHQLVLGRLHLVAKNNCSHPTETGHPMPYPEYELLVPLGI